MSTQARTDAVSPHELARKGGQFIGEIPFVAFQRLQSLAVGKGVVRIELRFEQDEQGRSCVRGRATTAVILDCQRCLEPIERRIVADVDFRVVPNDAAADEIANEFETYVSADEEVSVVELIEDDLILALPNQVCDAYDACPRRPDLKYPRDDADQDEAPRANPFAALADWQKRRN